MKKERRILKVVAFPLVMLMIVIVIGVWVHVNARQLAERQAQLIEASFMAAKRAELRNYIDLAKSAIKPLYNSNSDFDDAVAQEKAKVILRNIDYGSDGYFFVYDLSGNNLVHPRQSELEGTNLGGIPAIRSLLHTAQQGDGFQRYVWSKPSTHQETEKLGYVVLLERWGWVLGTGIYLDDVAKTTHEVRRHITGTLDKLMAITLTALLSVFIVGLLLNAREHRLAERELKTMAQRIVASQEEERARVSRELHEGLAAPLISAKWKLELAEKTLGADGMGERESLRDGLDKVAQVINEVRRISHGLRPAALDKLGVAAAIDQLKMEFALRTGTRVHIENTLGKYRFNEHQEVALYRIAQEALTNIERHAAATDVHMILARRSTGVEFTIADNGRGFDTSQITPDSGIGLRNIKERVEYLNGRFEIVSAPGGSRLTVLLPGAS